MNGRIGKMYKIIALISPCVEINLRKVYWKNIKFLKKFNPHKPSTSIHKQIKNVNFEKIIEWYKHMGIGQGDLLIVHSSYAGLAAVELSPDQIIDNLLKLIGPNGTLVMPVIRSYREEPNPEQLLKVSTDNVISVYDVKRTPVTSGLLPFRLMRRKNALISHHPLNPLCAIGPLAKKMMANNLYGDFPSPHGPYSSWRFCYDHGAKVVSLGIDIEHHNTIIHIAEESFDNWKWSDTEWFRKRIFDIIDEEKQTQRIVVKERKPIWGLLHFTDIRLNHDLKKLNIMKVNKIENIVEVGYVDVQKLIPYLRSKNNTGYPYYVC